MEQLCNLFSGKQQSSTSLMAKKNEFFGGMTEKGEPWPFLHSNSTPQPTVDPTPDKNQQINLTSIQKPNSSNPALIDTPSNPPVTEVPFQIQLEIRTSIENLDAQKN
ncbi:hypothetical protein L484_025644 [Morus notabilis]|uniref:Uncharacterized protein n=1 Tax=Morus notabilis TaxID=981085 RepID=W9R8Y2_9ROSA|nr:hypothetical protein L484_025644 [Morus notabilis]